MKICRDALVYGRPVVAIVFILIAIVAASSAMAQQYREIDWPAQPLQEALAAVGRTYTLSVVAPGDLVRDKMAPAVSGRFTAEQTLALLLRGSGLEVRHAAGGAWVVRGIAVSGGELSSGHDTGKELRLAAMTVTGERTERTLYETASSAVVVSGEDISNTPAFREVDDVLQWIPNVDLGGASNEGPTIRGVKVGGVLSGVDAFMGGSRSRATITVDGRPVTFNEFIFGASSVWDVDRLEVFRGPQTTAQGVNSIAGAIHVLTADPTFEPEARAQVGFGDPDHVRVSGAASLPLVEEELAGRVSIDFQRRDSFMSTYRTTDYGPDPGAVLDGVARGKLLWRPSTLPELEMKLTLSRSQHEGVQAEYIKSPLKDRKAMIANMATWRIVADAGVHDLSYAFSDDVEIRNRLSYAHIESERFVFPASTGAALSDRHEVANESTLHWKVREAGLSGLVGVFCQYASSDEKVDISAFPRVGKVSFDDKQVNVGLYGEVNYAITDRLDMTLSLRHQSDRQRRAGGSANEVTGLRVNYDKTFVAFLPRFSIGYDLTDSFRIGALVSRGFNPGGTTVHYTDGTENSFDEETVWNYELFSRARFFGDRLILNANAFYADYADYQLRTVTGYMAGAPVYRIANADKAVGYGLELNCDYLPVQSLRLFGGLGLLHTEIKRYSDSLDPDIVGSPFMRSPDITLSLGADYQLLDGLSLGGRIRYVGEYKSEDTKRSVSAGNYAVCDLQAAYTYKNTTIYGYANNVFDRFYTISELSNGRGIVGNPREYGIGVKFIF